MALLKQCSTMLLGTVLVVGSATAESRKVTVVEGKAPADYVAVHSGKSWAVVIGIDEYHDAKIPRLKYAVADARAIGKELERRGYQVKLLLNEQATARAINTELRSKLRQRARKNDRVVVYYAGHGQDDKHEGSRTMGYLLPADGELDNIPGTGISMGVIRELADALPAKHVLFLLDACFGGVAGQQTRSLPKMNEAYVRQITRERGRQLITAGGADQEALEASDGGHGLFTTYLLKGLAEGLADLNNDGIIPASELYAYLDNRVFSEAQMRGHQQRPEIWTLSAEKGEFVFFTTSRSESSIAESGARLPTSELKDQNLLNRPQEQFQALGSSSNEVIQPPSTPQDVAMLPPPRIPGSTDDGGRAERGVVVVNDVALDESWIEAFREAGLRNLSPGRYWFDEKSGFWGREGEPPSGQSTLGRGDSVRRVIEKSVFLGFGGKKEKFSATLKANVSQGTTRVFINGRELPEAELLEMRSYLPTLTAGRYQLDREGFFGPEGTELKTYDPRSLNLNKLKQAQLSGGVAQTNPYGTPPIAGYELVGGVMQPRYYAPPAISAYGGYQSPNPYTSPPISPPQQGVSRPPLVRSLPKIEPPPGWHSHYDSLDKMTKFVPPNLPQNREVMVGITDRTSLPNPGVSAERIHEAIVLNLDKDYMAKGFRTERSMTRETRGTIPSSTGVYILPEGKTVWVSTFTLVSATDGQFILFISDGEDLHKAYLPTVRAMVGEAGGR